ncbi:hypothetical protein [Rhizobium sp. LjRoot254]|uniref:hypothetical protein n=1 Tax=Rhizobium sp. LjRoot254 TaxID=3342297 RepID=UPI003ECF60F9
MDIKRLTYTDFQRVLLYKLAVAVEADFDRPIDVADVALTVNGKFQQSWISAVTQKFVLEKYIRKWARPLFDVSEVLNADEGSASKLRRAYQWGEAGADLYTLTEKGLEEAERIAAYEGWNLWPDIDEVAEQGFGSSVVEQGRKMTLNRDSSDFREVETGLNTAIEELRSDNMLMSDAEGGQRLAELEAGKVLIQSEQVNENLIKRVLIPSLTWTAKKIRDEGAVSIIKIGVAKLIALLSG